MLNLYEHVCAKKRCSSSSIRFRQCCDIHRIWQDKKKNNKDVVLDAHRSVQGKTDSE